MQICAGKSEKEQDEEENQVETQSTLGLATIGKTDHHRERPYELEAGISGYQWQPVNLELDMSSVIIYGNR